jgi:hypothetical protein
MGNRSGRMSAAVEEGVAKFSGDKSAAGAGRASGAGVLHRTKKRKQFMKHVVAATMMAALMAAPLAARGPAGASISGSYVEARTAEVFTGGCIMNGEAATTGREALLVWKVDRGSFDGVSLNGLAVVAAIAGDQNLGIREIGGAAAETRAAIFVDERATPAQRSALVAMAKQHSNGMVSKVVEMTASPIQFADDANAIRVTAKSLRLTVAKEMDHDPSCGARQWFRPLAEVSSSMMGTTSENAFTGTALGTKWSDPNKRSSFFGTFAY